MASLDAYENLLSRLTGTGGLNCAPMEQVLYLLLLLNLQVDYQSQVETRTTCRTPRVHLWDPRTLQIVSFYLYL